MWVDPDKFQQIVGNLVENALRHGAGTVTVCLRPAEVGGRPGAVVTVADEGEGIPDAVPQPHLHALLARRPPRRHRPRALHRQGPGRGARRHDRGRPADGGGAVFRFVLPAGTPEAFLED